MTFYELEKKCKARKKRFYLILIFFILIFILSLTFIFYLLFHKTNRPKIPKKTIPAKIVKEKTPKKVIKKAPKKSKQTLKFILPDIEINNSTKKENSTKQIKNSKKFLPVINVKKEKIKEKSENKKEKNTTSKKMILITNTIPSFETCINLAKRYFKEQNYQEALKWAKYANMQNKKDAASWIITAKILYAKGKKEEALRLLKIYNSYYNNKEVKHLIKEFNEK